MVDLLFARPRAIMACQSKYSSCGMISTGSPSEDQQILPFLLEWMRWSMLGVEYALLIGTLDEPSLYLDYFKIGTSV